MRAMQSGWVAPAGPDLDAFEARGRRRASASPTPSASPRAPRPCTWPWCRGASARATSSGLHLHLRRDRQRHPLRRRRAVLRRLRRGDGQHEPDAARAGASTSCRPTGARCRSIVPVDLSASASTTTRSARSPTAPARGSCATPRSRWARPYGGRAAGSFGDASVRVVQRQQDHDHLRRRHAADRRPSAWPTTCASCRPRPASRWRTTSTPRSATTTGSPTSSPRSAAPSSLGSTT